MALDRSYESDHTKWMREWGACAAEGLLLRRQLSAGHGRCSGAAAYAFSRLSGSTFR